MDRYVVSNRSSIEARLEVRQHWAALVPRRFNRLIYILARSDIIAGGNGQVRVAHSDHYTKLGSPLVHYITGEEYYLTSMVHQLHCLVSLPWIIS